MALNRFMHPRNLYRNKKPDFLALALKYPEFKELSIQDLNGKVTLDFKNPESVRVLSQTLLKEDFNIDVDLPNDRLIPTLSSRLNYIHWIEDMFNGQYQNLSGIDIGTGASCIYPILGCKLNNWTFLATEIDEKNYQYACQNIQRNKMDGKIKVVKVEENTGIPESLILQSDKNYDFIMCNPPFFADHMEAQAITSSRKTERPDPSSLSTAEDCESIVPGGEAAFIKNMIQDSFILKDRIRVFTSMVGKKINMSVIKDELKKRQIKNFATTEFCQGKTMRWGIAWSFDDTIKFPKSHFEKKKKKGTTPLIYEIPFDNGIVLYDIRNITAYIIEQLQILKVKYKEGKRTETGATITMTAYENTWSHQRRKRRQEKLTKTESETCDEKSTETTNKTQNLTMENKKLKLSTENLNNNCEEKDEEKDKIQNFVMTETKKSECDHTLVKITDEKTDISTKIPQEESAGKHSDKTVASDSSASDNKNKHILKCRLVLRKKDNTIELEVIDLDKVNRDFANQILQYFKNKLKSKT